MAYVITSMNTNNGKRFVINRKDKDSPILNAVNNQKYYKTIKGAEKGLKKYL